MSPAARPRLLRWCNGDGEHELLAKRSPLCGGQRIAGITSQCVGKLPLVTVITCIYNGQPHVADAWKVCSDGPSRNLEHVVIDGGSTDGTVDVLQQYDQRVAFWKSEPDKGL